jgi:arylsulfatase A-like enzyme
VDGLPRGVGAYFSEKGMRLLSREMEIQRTRAKAYMEEHGLKELDRIQAKEFRSRGLPWEAPDVPDDALPDGRSARRAIEILRDRKNQDAPFFLAVGFRKPHLPFVAPKKYWDLYDPDQIRLADNPFPPKGAPPFAMTSFGELRNYHGMPSSGPLSPDNAREAIHGYYACVSYTDAQIGRLLEELGDLDLRDRTILILWGDHGWKLGEHGGWCKHTNFENDTHVPLIISVPGMPAGTKSAALVEFVDIYPTLAELCDLPLPGHLEGKSFVPQIENPDAPGKSAVFSQYHRSHQGTRLMGYSMRTHRFRYTEWRGRASGEVHSIELYDHDIDPKENVNQANNPAYAKVLMDLEELMDGGWQSQNR